MNSQPDPAGFEAMRHAMVASQLRTNAVSDIRVVAAFAAQPDAGTLGIDGKMYDIPHLKLAHRVLAAAGDNQK